MQLVKSSNWTHPDKDYRPCSNNTSVPCYFNSTTDGVFIEGVEGMYSNNLSVNFTSKEEYWGLCVNKTNYLNVNFDNLKCIYTEEKAIDNKFLRINL